MPARADPPSPSPAESFVIDPHESRYVVGYVGSRDWHPAVASTRPILTTSQCMWSMDWTRSTSKWPQKEPSQANHSWSQFYQRSWRRPPAEHEQPGSLNGSDRVRPKMWRGGEPKPGIQSDRSFGAAASRRDPQHARAV